MKQGPQPVVAHLTLASNISDEDVLRCGFVPHGCRMRFHEDLSQFSGSRVFSEEQKAAALEKTAADIDPSFARGIVESIMSMQVDIRVVEGGVELESTIAQRELWHFACVFRKISDSDFILAIDSPDMSSRRLKLSSPNEIEISFGTETESDDEPMHIWKLTKKPESNQPQQPTTASSAGGRG